MAWTWVEFDAARDHKGMAGWINGFRLRHLKADCDTALLPIIVGHFVTDALTGECTDWVETSQETVQLTGEVYAAYKAAKPTSLDVPMLTQVYGLCYQAIIATKGAEWAGTLHPAVE